MLDAATNQLSAYESGLFYIRFLPRGRAGKENTRCTYIQTRWTELPERGKQRAHDPPNTTTAVLRATTASSTTTAATTTPHLEVAARERLLFLYFDDAPAPLLPQHLLVARRPPGLHPEVVVTLTPAVQAALPPPLPPSHRPGVFLVVPVYHVTGRSDTAPSGLAAGRRLEGDL